MSRCKPVAYLVNQYPAISHTFVRREILALERLGYRVRRFTVRPPFDALVDPLDLDESARTQTLLRVGPGLLAMTVLAIRHPVRFLHSIGTLYHCWRRGGGPIRHAAYLLEAAHLVRRLRQLRCEHLHVHFGTNSTTVALLSSRLGGPPFSFTVHGPEEFDRPERESLPLKIEAAAFVVAISSFGRSQLLRWTAYDQWSKIHVVRCGLDAAFLDQSVPPVPDVHRLVCVGRLSEQKGYPILLQATRRLVDQGHELQVVCIGDGPLRGDLEREIQRLGLGGVVLLVGWQTQAEIQSHLANSRCFVLPSFAEGLPVVLMEALAMGRSVISTYVAGIPELVEPGRNGWLVPAGDAQRLAEAMREALTTPVERLSEMGAQGKTRVARQHAVDDEARRLGELFERG